MEVRFCDWFECLCSRSLTVVVLCFGGRQVDAFLEAHDWELTEVDT